MTKLTQPTTAEMRERHDADDIKIIGELSPLEMRMSLKQAHKHRGILLDSLEAAESKVNYLRKVRAMHFGHKLKAEAKLTAVNEETKELQGALDELAKDELEQELRACKAEDKLEVLEGALKGLRSDYHLNNAHANELQTKLETLEHRHECLKKIYKDSMGILRTSRVDELIDEYIKWEKDDE